MFHDADRGLPPPQIRGYRLEDGHTTDKLNHVLNAFYGLSIEKNRIEPMTHKHYSKSEKPYSTGKQVYTT